MKRIRKRILAAALAMAMFITAPGTAVYATEDVQTGSSLENETIETADTDPEDAEAEDVKVKDSGTENDGVGESGTGSDDEGAPGTESGGQKKSDTEGGDISAEETTEEGSPYTYEYRLCLIEELIAALPEEVTADNAEEVRALLDEILALYIELTEGEQEQIDLSRCLELQRMLDEDNVPMSLEEPDEGSVAMVEKDGGTTYAKTLTEAFAGENSGGVVTLLSDVILTEKLTIAADFTLDLNGRTITGEDNGILSYNNLTIRDSGATGKITSAKNAVSIAGIVTLEGGSFTTDDLSQYAGVKLFGSAAGLIVTGGNVSIDCLAASNISGNPTFCLSGGMYGRIKIPGTMVFAAILGTNYAYYGADGKPLALDGLGKKNDYGALTLTGPVTVKECRHDYEGDSEYTRAEGTTTHSRICPACGKKVDENCSYVDGECVCGSKLEVILPADLNLTYDGTEKKPAVTVTVDGQTMAETHYTVTYANNINAGTNTAKVIVNGTAFEGTVTKTFSISKAEGKLTVPARVITKKFGDPEFSLNCSAEGDGTISYHSDKESVVTVSADGKVQIKGMGTAAITISLAEGTNHTADSRTITITVGIGGAPSNKPDSIINVPDWCVAVGDVALPENWIWKEQDREKALTDETPVEAVAVYAGADQDHYEIIEVTVAVISHAVGKEIVYTEAGEKEPTCMETGRGHRECAICHVVLVSDIVVEALGHDYKDEVSKEPTTTEEGECTYTCIRCGDTYTESIPKVIPDGLWISGLTESVSYTGSAIKQDNIKVYHGSTLLREKTEYTISYKNNTNASVISSTNAEAKANADQRAQVIVTGKGNYKGKCTAEFTIAPIVLGNGTSETGEGIHAIIATATETGRNLKPAVTVTWNGKKLKEKKDYTLSYAANIKTASEEGYDVVITGQGNFIGSIVGKFHVKAKGMPLLNKATVKGLKKSYEYQSAEQSGNLEILPKDLENDLDNITVKVSGKILTKDTDYTVRTENTSCVGTGYVVIEAVPGGVYAGEKRIACSIIGTNLKKYFITGVERSYSYTGESIRPEIEVYSAKNGTGTKVPSDAYTVSYSNHVNQGKATVTVTGIPEKGYSGSIKATYTIARLNLADNRAAEASAKGIKVTMPGDIKYAKGGAKPQPVVTHTYKGTVRTLREGVDYTLKYNHNTAVYGSVAFAQTSDGETPVDYAKEGGASIRSTKKPTVKITGIGNYTGTITENYDIAAQDMGSMEITVTDKAYNSKKRGSYYYSIPKVYDLDGKLLKSGKDYEIKYTYATEDDRDDQPVSRTDPVEPGTKICVTVMAKEPGNYIGTLSAAYFVRDTKDVKDIAKTQNDKIAAQQYTGKACKPEAKLYTQTGKTKNYLSKDNYEIIGYYDNIKRGTATVLIKGVGSYSGVKRITFKITSANNKSIWCGIF